MNKYYYKIFGLQIESELELPGLTVSRSDKIDVKIKYGQVPEELVNPEKTGVLYQTKQNDFIYSLQDVSRYRVQNGDTIIIQPNIKASPEEIRLFLMGSTMGGLLHQRGVLPIHGSAIEKDNNAFIITGSSSSGKSSLAAAISKLGYSVITDDISAIAFRDENEVFVQPGTPYLKLWKDVLTYFNESQNLQRVRPQLEKYYYPVKSITHTDPIPLKSIIVLTSKNTPGFVYDQIHGAEKFSLLMNNTYRLQYSEPYSQSIIQFKNLMKLANCVEVFLLQRPAGPLKVNQLADYIQKEIFVS